MYTTTLKRLLDCLIACFALLVFSPLMLVIALLVWRKLGTPVIFRQQRPGLNETLFTMVKFRTMRDAVDKHGQPLPDSERLTAFGRWLRATSLDELPELWNVLRGEMSLVGPRPLLAEYLPLYNDQQRRRHDVRPGITGWAQVNGRNAIDWEQKFALDVWYVDHVSFGLDVKIIAMTLRRVLKREAISAEGHATMPKFNGTVHKP
jgi:lipopolysaccharide/colanic/teichoic acid biosynthesis glycosyltransferase